MPIHLNLTRSLEPPGPPGPSDLFGPSGPPGSSESPIFDNSSSEIQTSHSRNCFKQFMLQKFQKYSIQLKFLISTLDRNIFFYRSKSQTCQK